MAALNVHVSSSHLSFFHSFFLFFSFFLSFLLLSAALFIALAPAYSHVQGHYAVMLLGNKSILMNYSAPTPSVLATASLFFA